MKYALTIILALFAIATAQAAPPALANIATTNTTAYLLSLWSTNSGSGGYSYVFDTYGFAVSSITNVSINSTNYGDKDYVTNTVYNLTVPSDTNINFPNASNTFNAAYYRISMTNWIPTNTEIQAAEVRFANSNGYPVIWYSLDGTNNTMKDLH